MTTVDQYLADNRGRFIDELVAFCQQPSIAASGRGMREMAQMVAQRLEAAGARAEIVELEGGYPFVVGEAGQGERTLLVYNHYDVQPARREDGWTSDPFKPTIRDGRIYARGVADNKGNLLFRIQAMEAYRAIYGELPIRLRFLLDGEEEIGSPSIPQFVERHSDLLSADGCIWESGRKAPDGRPLLYLGVRGILYVELALRAQSPEIHSSWANIVESPALPLLRRMEQILSELTDDEGRPTFLMPHVPPPLESDRALLQNIVFDPAWTLRPGLSPAEALERLMFEPSCNICGVGVGYAEPGVKTVVPNSAVAKIDFRLPSGVTPEMVEELLRAHLHDTGNEDVEVRRLLALYPARSAPESLVVQSVIEAARISYGVEPIVYPMMAASGPMYELCQSFNIPAITFGAGHVEDRVHGVDENIYLDDYIQAIRCFVEVIRQFATEQAVEV